MKPHPPSGDGVSAVVMRGGPGPGPGSNDARHIDFENVTLNTLLGHAFDLKFSYQLTVPSWGTSERFDITATVPQGATKEQSRVMLQNLLAERLKMTFHREKTELSAYLLVTGKNGSKLKESVIESIAPTKNEVAQGAPPLLAPLPEAAGQLSTPTGKDGFPITPGGGGGNPITTLPARARITASGMVMSRFVDMLANQLGRPVLDGTGLKGKYDFTLYFEPETPNAWWTDPAPTLLIAVQQQLGLRLEATKAPVDMIVIDHVERVPSAKLIAVSARSRAKDQEVAALTAA